MARAVLYDSTLCVGCRQCEEACSARWKLPYNQQIAAEEQTSSHKLTAIRTHGERYSRKLCMNCLEPACASVCPVGALEKTTAGAVVYDEGKCVGCRYCMVACPFQVPAYEWERAIPKIRKCDLCSDRTSKGGITRCSEACPTNATITGERGDLIREAQQRIRSKPSEYYGRVYGLEEAGGTSVLILGAVPFDQLGYNTNVPKKVLPELTWAALQHVPDIVSLGGVLLGGVYWITRRREEVRREERA